MKGGARQALTWEVGDRTGMALPACAPTAVCLWAHLLCLLPGAHRRRLCYHPAAHLSYEQDMRVVRAAAWGSPVALIALSNVRGEGGYGVAATLSLNARRRAARWRNGAHGARTGGRK